MLWPINFRERDRTALFALSLFFVIVLLLIEIWAFTQTSYAKQEMDDWVLLLMLPFGLFLFLTSGLEVRRHRWRGVVGLAVSTLALLLFLWWRFFPRSIID